MCRMGSNEGPQFLGFSDCIMMTILSYLDATSLYNLSQTCLYFKNIVEDKNLWKYMDCRDEPNTDDKVKYCSERLNEKTTHAFFKAHSKKVGVIPKNFFKKIEEYDNITVLALENQRLSGEDISMKTFPKNLEELSLRRTHVKNGERFFQYSRNRMSKLRVLIVDSCNWLDSSFLMSIAKYPNLEILSIVKCNRLHHNVMPYLSVARHGFKKLKVLDARFNTIGNDFLREFNTKSSILALYFQSMRSYHIDTGVPIMRNVISNLSRDELELMGQNIISSRSLHNYKYVTAESSEPLPKSLLYNDPYPECTCKFSSFHEEREYDVPDSLMKVDDFLDFHNNTPQKFICKRHINEVHRLPTEFRDFFMQNQRLFQGGDSSDENSEDESDNDCCMYGMGRAQQMIVLKVRNVEGDNQPQAEVYEFAPARNQSAAQQNKVPEQQMITVDLFGQRDDAIVERQDTPPVPQPEPSTSREESRSFDECPKEKRKCDESDNNANKKLKTDDNSVASSSGSDITSTSNSELDSSSSTNNDQVSESLVGAIVINPLPSTSNDNESSAKRKSEESVENDSKKIKTTDEAVPSTSRADDDQKPSTSTPLTEYEKKMLQDIPHIKTIQRLIEPSACIEASFYNYNGKKCIDRVYSQEALKAALRESDDDPSCPTCNTTEPEEPQPSTSRATYGDERPSTSSQTDDIDFESLAAKPEDTPPPPVEEEEGQDQREIENILLDEPELEIEVRKAEGATVKLKRLSLRGYRKVTDRALRHLRHLNLELLDLTYTNVTVRGVESFLSYNPDCRIIHKNFCVCKPVLLV